MTSALFWICSLCLIGLMPATARAQKDPASAARKVYAAWKNGADFGATGRAALKHQVEGAFAYESGGIHRAIVAVSTSYQGNDCHGCAPAFSVIEMQQVKGRWVTLFTQKNIGQYGEYGTAADVKMERIGSENYGLIFNCPWSGQGYTIGTYVLCAKVNGSYKKVLSAQIYEDNAGVEEHNSPRFYSWKAEMQFMEGGKLFNDILVASGGSKLPPDAENDSTATARKFQSRTRYVYADGEYRAVN